MLSVAHIALASLRQSGLWATVRAAPRFLLREWPETRRRERLRVQAEAEDGFDERWGTTTTDLLLRGNLKAVGDVTHALPYWPVLPRTFRKMMAAALVNHSDYVFIDLGCGKGRALFLATEFPFQRIIGVEFSPPCVDAANRNLAAFRSRATRHPPIEIYLQDATDFEFPEAPLFLFMFDPFRAPVLGPVLANLRASLAKHPRPVVIAYLNDVERHLLDWLPCVHEEPRNIPEYPWRIYRMPSHT